MANQDDSKSGDPDSQLPVNRSVPEQTASSPKEDHSEVGTDVPRSPPGPAVVSAGVHPPERAVSLPPKIKTSDFEVGKRSPKFNVDILEIIFITDMFVVFLDSELSTYWWCADKTKVPLGLGVVLNRIAELEAIPIGALPRSIRRSFRVQVAEGVARALDENNSESAVTAHDKAEKFVRSRLAERARLWQLTPTVWSLILTAVLMGATRLLSLYGKLIPLDIAWFSLCVLSGALGSSFSLTARLGDLQLDAAAGRKLHVREALARVCTGAVSGCIATFAMKSGQLFPALVSNSLSAALLICFAAGYSERFIPNLVTQLDKTESGGKGRPAGQPPTPGSVPPPATPPVAGLQPQAAPIDVPAVPGPTQSAQIKKS